MDTIEIFKEIIGILKPYYSPIPLNPPATISEINAFEKDIGVVLPEDFKSIYLLHNGELDYKTHETFLGLFCGYEFLSLEKIRILHKEWKSTKEFYDDTLALTGEDDSDLYTSIPLGTVKNEYISNGWLPIAGYPPMNAHLALDFSPDDKGVYGQVINCGRDDYIHHQLAKDFKGFLVFILEQYKLEKFHHKLDLESGEYFFVDILSDIKT